MQSVPGPRAQKRPYCLGFNVLWLCLDIKKKKLSLNLDFVSEVWLDNGAHGRGVGSLVYMWPCTPLSPYSPGTDSWLLAAQIIKEEYWSLNLPWRRNTACGRQFTPHTRVPSLSFLIICPINFRLTFLAPTIIQYIFLNLDLLLILFIWRNSNWHYTLNFLIQAIWPDLSEWKFSQRIHFRAILTMDIYHLF